VKSVRSWSRRESQLWRTRQSEKKCKPDVLPIYHKADVVSIAGYGFTEGLDNDPALDLVTGSGAVSLPDGTRACQSPMTIRKSSATRELGTDKIRRAHRGPADKNPAYIPRKEKNPNDPYRTSGGRGGFPLLAGKTSHKIDQREMKTREQNDISLSVFMAFRTNGGIESRG
jgi:hypothetical protein